MAGAEPVRPIASQRLERPLSQQTNRVHSDKATEAIVHAWTLANKYEIDFESAMVIVVGQQSAGKTSFVERYLGYAFSVVRNGIATKRPSVLTILPSEAQDN